MSNVTGSGQKPPPLIWLVLFAVFVVGPCFMCSRDSDTPTNTPQRHTRYKTNRERLQEYHDQGKFLGYPLSEADQWAKDMDALIEARKSEYYAPD